MSLLAIQAKSLIKELSIEKTSYIYIHMFITLFGPFLLNELFIRRRQLEVIIHSKLQTKKRNY